MTTLHFERTYPHPPSRVWRALTTPELLAEWLMPNDFAPEVGHEFTFRTDPGPGFDGIVHCRVLEVTEPERLTFSWRGGPIDTVVTFVLTPDGGSGGTRLTFEQSGFRGFKAWIVRLMLRAGFASMFSRKLPRLLERLGGGAPSDDATDARAEPVACHGPFHRLRVGLLRVLTPRRGRRDDSPRSDDAEPETR